MAAQNRVSSSLVICSRNRPLLLAETVQSVLRGDVIPDELVIVDQSDSPNLILGEAGFESGCAIRYLPITSIGLCRARNIGIAAASHDLLAFCDDDMFLAPGWYSALTRTASSAGPRAVVTGPVLPADVAALGGFAPALKLSRAFAIFSGRTGTDVLAAGNMALFREALDRVGPFDERLGAGAPFPAADDNEIGHRLLMAGHHIIYEPDAIVYHRAWRPAAAFLPLRWRYGRGQGAFYAKHWRLRDPYMARRFYWDVVRHGIQFAQRIRKHRRAAAGDFVFVLGLFAGALGWALTQRAEQRDRESRVRQ